MQRLLRRWRLLLAALFVFAIGWMLYEFLPIEPRWRLRLDKSYRGALHFVWDRDSRVRFIADAQFAVNDVLPLFPTNILLDVGDGTILDRNDSPLGIWNSFTVSSDARYALGHMVGDRVYSRVDFAAGSKKELNVGEGQIQSLGFSRAGDLFFVEYDAGRGYPEILRSDKAEIISKVRGASRPTFLIDGRHVAYIADGYVGILHAESGESIASFPFRNPPSHIPPNRTTIILI